MKRIRIALLAGALALAVVPATALATPTYHPGGGPNYTPAPPPHGKAFGFFCQGQSKKHVKGEKGTAFSRCVKAMARAKKNERMSARRACRGLSRKHVKGHRGTPFSRCVKGVAKLRREQRRIEREAAAG